MEVEYFKEVHFIDVFIHLFFLVLNKVIIYKTQIICSLIAKHSGFIKFTVNKLNWII